MPSKTLLISMNKYILLNEEYKIILRGVSLVIYLVYRGINWRHVPGPEQLEIKRYLFSADHRKHSGGESEHDTYIHTYTIETGLKRMCWAAYSCLRLMPMRFAFFQHFLVLIWIKERKKYLFFIICVQYNHISLGSGSVFFSSAGSGSVEYGPGSATLICSYDW